MSTLHIPFRHDHVGSFLRPVRLKDARIRYEAGSISAEQLKQIEDEEIAALIEKQKQAGCLVITDGEFRRSYWHLDFMWGFQGIQKIELDHGYFFHGEETTPGSIEVIGKISGEDHPFVEHFRFVKQFEEEGIVAKQTIPAPAQHQCSQQPPGSSLQPPPPTAAQTFPGCPHHTPVLRVVGADDGAGHGPRAGVVADGPQADRVLGENLLLHVRLHLQPAGRESVAQKCLRWSPGSTKQSPCAMGGMMWLPHPWRCSRPGWMEPGAA